MKHKKCSHKLKNVGLFFKIFVLMVKGKKLKINKSRNRQK